jgi:hypothetical protein
MQQLAVTFDLNNDTICRRSCYGSLLWVESSMGWGCGREPDTLLTASWCLLNLKINQQSECGGWIFDWFWLLILDAFGHACWLHGFQTQVLGPRQY